VKACSAVFARYCEALADVSMESAISTIGTGQLGEQARRGLGDRGVVGRQSRRLV